MRAIVIALVVALLPLAAAAENRTVEVESLKITIDSDWVVRAAPGYLPVRFDITNLGEDRVIEITGQGSRYFRGRGGRAAATRVQQAVRLARGDRVRLTIPVPIHADNESMRFDIREGGRVLELFNFTSIQSRVRAEEASALIVADQDGTFGQTATKWPRPLAVTAGGGVRIVTPPPAAATATSTPTIMGMPGGRPLDLLLHPARVPTNWLGFTSLRAVVIGPTEWEQLSDAQKTALLTWTACGGDLLFVDGSIGALFPAGQHAPAATLDGVAGGYFLGRIHLLSSSAIQSAGLGTVLTKTATMKDANWALPANSARDWGTIASRGFRLAIPGVGGVPTRAYLAILVAFSVLIGPVNYWFLWRKRQQVLLVLTTPLISLVFILLLAGYVLAGEGLGVYGRAVSFTMLDQARKQAVMRASASLYAAGMTPSGGLRFARELAVFPIGPDGTGSRSPQVLDLTDVQQFVDGGIQARYPANIETIGTRAARERLTFTPDGGGVRVMNGLGATVFNLIYRERGAIHRLAAALPAGGEGLLQPAKSRAADLVPAGLPWSSRLEHLFDNLPDGAYLAILDRSPFWDPGITRIEERDSFHVVFGWVAGQP